MGNDKAFTAHLATFAVMGTAAAIPRWRRTQEVEKEPTEEYGPFQPLGSCALYDLWIDIEVTPRRFVRVCEGRSGPVGGLLVGQRMTEQEVIDYTTKP
jgi:hypothetical protein